MVDSNIPELTRNNINEDVYKILKERILSKQFAPGQRMQLRELEKQMGISRTPIKDALNRLTMEGLIEIRARKGTYVTDPSPTTIAESFDVRLILEVYAIDLIAKQLTESQIEQLGAIEKKMGKLINSEDWKNIYQEFVALDHEMHSLFMKFSGNKCLEESWERISIHSQMVRVRYLYSGAELKLTYKEHQEIMHALEEKKAVAARKALRNHINRAKYFLVRNLEMEHDKES